MNSERRIDMSQKLLFIGNYTDDATYQIITQHDIRDLSQAARLFQNRLINSLADKVDHFQAISVLPTNEEIILPKIVASTKTKVKVIPIVNGSIKSAIQAMRSIRNLIIDECGKDTKVLMYAVNPIAILPLLRLKKKYNLTLVTICPELPQFRRYRKSVKNDIKRKVFDFFNRRFDRYIVFAEAMREYLPEGKPCMALEGFAPETVQKPQVREKNIAMYAGGLAEDNGIRMMIEAAHKSELIDELWICGVGDCLEYVKSATDNKVKYLGRLTNSEVLNYEKQAKILLNVRNPQNDLTKFSFPSKVLEYMTAGGIVISSELRGIPKEYNEHIELLKDYTADGLAIAMDKIFGMDDALFLKKTESACAFVAAKGPNQRAIDVMTFLEQGGSK